LDGKRYHSGTGQVCLFGCIIGARIVNHQDWEIADGANLIDDLGYGRALVESGYQNNRFLQG
jgi:hypothetical protein